MNYFWMTIIVTAFTAGILFLMWRSWQKGKEAGIINTGFVADPSAEALGAFQRVLYVSTNRAGEPLVRVQYPGLRYRGYADVEVRTDGISIKVAGEKPAWVAAQQIDDVKTEQMRIGKVVERDGLATVSWHTTIDNLESSFRFQQAQEQMNFMHAVRKIKAGSSESE